MDILQNLVANTRKQQSPVSYMAFGMPLPADKGQQWIAASRLEDQAPGQRQYALWLTQADPPVDTCSGSILNVGFTPTAGLITRTSDLSAFDCGVVDHSGGNG